MDSLYPSHYPPTRRIPQQIDTERTKIFVMLRPRRGIDFKYSGGEMEAILFDLGQFKTHGADGFVFGALNTSRNIDVEACCRVVKAAVPLPVTFHRAFDVLDREVLGANVEQLIDLGFKRILTSGCHETAEKGSAVIGGLTEDYGGRIIFLTGGGIEPGNLQRLIDQTKCKEFHGSCRMKGTFERDAIIGDLVKNVPTDEHKVREMINILKQT